jgi:hypothetical protein
VQPLAQVPQWVSLVWGLTQLPLQQILTPPHSVSSALFWITHVPPFVQKRCLHGALAGGSGHWPARVHG